MSITGVILAGGQGRRMGGVDKGLLEFQNRPLVTHVIERLQSQVDELLINANREIEQYTALGYKVIKDDIAGFAGPLAGLHKAMSVAKHPYILAVPCDSPLLPMDLASRLMHDLIQYDVDLAVAKTGSQTHPVFCLFRKALLPNLQNFLRHGDRKVALWHAALDVVEVSFNDNPQAFINVNTREDLRFLEHAA